MFCNTVGIFKKIAAKEFTLSKIDKFAGSINGKLLKLKSPTSFSQGFKFRLVGNGY